LEKKSNAGKTLSLLLITIVNCKNSCSITNIIIDKRKEGRETMGSPAEASSRKHDDFERANKQLS
jgi:hypothetical protein